MMKRWTFWILLLPLILMSCGDRPSTTRSGLKTKNFQTIVDGKTVGLYVLSNKNGMEVCITNYGGRIVSMMVPDKKRKLQDVVLGFDSIGSYLHHMSDFGAVVGRFIGGVHSRHMNYHPAKNAVELNDKDNANGFQYKVFDAQQLGDQKLVLTYISKDGEDGFPGNLICSISYKLSDDNSLKISFDAGTDRPTLINLSSHVYFNLSGDPSLPCTDERLMIHAKNFLPINKTLIPSGKTTSATNTPFDFHKQTVIDKNIHDGWNDQLKYGNGFNHHYLLYTKEDINKKSAELFSQRSGIILKIFTDKPIIYFYSGNQLDGTITGKHNIAYNQHAGIVLAPQDFPDASNVSSKWPSNLLKPGQRYQWNTIYTFSTSK